MKREPFEKRLLRIFAEAGYPLIEHLSGGNGGNPRRNRPQYPGRFRDSEAVPDRGTAAGDLEGYALGGGD